MVDSLGWTFLKELSKGKEYLKNRGCQLEEIHLVVRREDLKQVLETCSEDEVESLAKDIAEKGIDQVLKGSIKGIRIDYDDTYSAGYAALRGSCRTQLIIKMDDLVPVQ